MSDPLTLTEWERKLPAFAWREPLRITIAPQRDPNEKVLAVTLRPGQVSFGGTALLVCRTCVANYGFKAEDWESCEYAWVVRGQGDPSNTAAHLEAEQLFAKHIEAHLRGE